MKKILIIISLLFLTSCWDNNINKEKDIIKINNTEEKWILWDYEKSEVNALIKEIEQSEIICLWDYIYKDKYKIKNNLDLDSYKYIPKKSLHFKKEYSYFDVPEFNIDKRQKEFSFWCTWDFLIWWKTLYKNTKKEEIIKKYKNYQKLNRNNKKYSYEELLDVFAISWNFCLWDVLYKSERYIITKDYSDYQLWTFQPSLEEQKKYDELTKNKIYWDENALDFLAKYEMYCLWWIFDWYDWISHNPLKYKHLKKYYKENEEAKNIVKILEEPEEIDWNKLFKLLIFSNKFPTFYEEIKNKNKNININKIFNNLKKKKERIEFFIILDNITRYTKSELVFDEIAIFYKDIYLLEKKKDYLIKDLEYKKHNLWFLDFNYYNALEKLNKNIWKKLKY